MDFNDYIENHTPEQIKLNYLKQVKENEDMFEDFKNAYRKGCCSLCGNKLSSFYPSERCFHWFLRPEGIRKKDFEEYLSEPIGFFSLESYFRWIANIDALLKNINDITYEKSPSKLKEITVKLKNIEWTLNYGKNDLEGHQNATSGKFPHFHLQMLVDNQPFLRFNDYHIPFSKLDLKRIRFESESQNKFKFTDTNGAGMSIVENEDCLEYLIENAQIAKDKSSATFSTQSMVIIPDGIPQQEFNKIQQESKLTRIPMRSLFQKYYPDAQILTHVKPGNGVPELKKRNKR